MRLTKNTIRAVGVFALSAFAAASFASSLSANPTATPDPAHPGCALTGSPNVLVEGKSMLRLGDVQACPHLRYEIVPNVFINGQPAVRLLPTPSCAAGGAKSVTADGRAVGRQGDGC